MEVTSTLEQTHPVPLAAMEHLKAHGECDRCGSGVRAFAAARFAAGLLLLCGHHFAKHEDALRRSALTVLDWRDEIPA